MFQRGIRRLATLTAMLCACGGGGSATGPAASRDNPGNSSSQNGGNTVTLDASNTFVPGIVNVNMGMTVTWKWATCSGDGYSTCPTHSVTFDDGSGIASGIQNSGEFSRTFSAAGTYKYHCAVHGSGMAGQVVVK